MSWSGLREATKQATRAQAYLDEHFPQRKPMPSVALSRAVNDARRTRLAFQAAASPAVVEALLDEVELLDDAIADALDWFVGYCSPAVTKESVGERLAAALKESRARQAGVPVGGGTR